MAQNEYFRGHAGLGEWLRSGGSERADEFAVEDLTKTDRLQVLRGAIALPTVPTVKFAAERVLARGEDFVEFEHLATGRPYALRLRRQNGAGTLARNRGLPIPELVEWAASQGSAIETCIFEFEQHVEAERAVTLIVGVAGVSLEATEGSLAQLSKGLVEDSTTYVGQGDPAEVSDGASTEQMRDFLRRVLGHLVVADEAQIAMLHELGVPVSGWMLDGYFEAILADEEIYFVDYNRMLAGIAPDVLPLESTASDGAILRGRVGSPGMVTGRARLVLEDVPPPALMAGDIIVARFTSPDLAPLMASASGVITEIGGVLSHAAVLCRELHLPALVGATNALQLIAEGDVITLDASHGEVRRP